MTSVTRQEMPFALAEFDRLPDSAHVNIKVVAGLYGSGISTIWAKLKRREIPNPHKFGRSTRWNVGDLRAALSTGVV